MAGVTNRGEFGFGRPYSHYAGYGRFSETVSERNRRREAEIAEALQGEAARHAATIRNMHRLRALRLERDRKAKAP
jgi:hypothetical protein